MRFYILFFWLFVFTSGVYAQTSLNTKNQNAAVLVLDPGGFKSKKGWSNGVIVSRSGHVLTVSHGLSNKSSYDIKFLSGKTEKARVIYRSQHQDFALLKIIPKDSGEKRSWEHVQIKNPSSNRETKTHFNLVALKKIKNSIEVISKDTRSIFDGLDYYTFQDSWISNLKHKKPPIIAEGMIISESVQPGLSGAGLFDLQGDLVGMVIGVVNLSGKERTVAVKPYKIQAIIDIEEQGVFENQNQSLSWMLNTAVKLGKNKIKDTDKLMAFKNEVAEDFSHDSDASLTPEQASKAWAEFSNRVESYKGNN